MSDFLDTNVLVYCYDGAEPDKQAVAQQLVEEADLHGAAISLQVLSELIVFLRRRRSPPASVEQTRRAVASLAHLTVVTPDQALVERALDAHERYGIHFYDGMIVAAAERAGCKRIWSEDLNPGQTYFGVRVEDPFAASRDTTAHRKS